MSNATIRPAYEMWPQYARRLREVVAGMTDEQLAIRPSTASLTASGRKQRLRWAP